MTDLRELREAVSFLKSKHIKILLSLAQTVLESPDRVEVEKFIPSYGDPIKHMPTDEQAEICKGAYLHYAKQVSKPDEYDFNRGFEFGYGACLLKKNACADIANAIIAKKDLEITELKAREISVEKMDTIIKNLEQELARVKEENESLAEAHACMNDNLDKTGWEMEKLEQELATLKARKELGEGER